LAVLFRFSGITEPDLCNVTTTLKDVQEKLKEIIPPDAILVGHSLEFDFASLQVSSLSLLSKII
jgi:RNA exonuclease 1